MKYQFNKFFFFSTLFIINYGRAQITDINGQTYKTVVIGSQTWMAENLNVDKFRNGDLIQEAKTIEEWQLAGENKQPVWCYYDFDSTNGVTHGKLYNWYAINDSRGLAPKKYHIPSIDEWHTLANYLGGDSIAGQKMKSNTGWASNDSSFGTSSFNALPSGCNFNDSEDSFLGLGLDAYFWSNTQSGLYNVFSHSILSHKQSLDIFAFTFKDWGLSVRCIKN